MEPTAEDIESFIDDVVRGCDGNEAQEEILDVEGPVEDIELIDDGITPPEVAAGEKRDVRDIVVLLHRPLLFAARDTP